MALRGAHHRKLAEYAYESMTRKPPGLGASPREAYQSGLGETGISTHRQIPYDREFLVLTLPTTPKGTARVVPGKGIQTTISTTGLISFAILRSRSRTFPYGTTLLTLVRLMVS